MTRLAFAAFGQPVPQGSNRAYGSRIVASNGHLLKPWRQTLASAAIEQAALDQVAQFTGPVVVRAHFYFRRPQHHYRTGKNAGLLRDSAPDFPVNRGYGDLDKLQRAVGDALVDVSILRDDDQIAAWRSNKRWCSPDAPMQQPGALIEVEDLNP